MTKLQIVKIANSLEMFWICIFKFVQGTPLELLVIFRWMPLAGIYGKKSNSLKTRI